MPATLIACADGNFTTSTTWALCDSTSELDSITSNIQVGTSNTDSSSFTPGAITIDGIAVRLWSRAASPTGTFTLKLRNSTDSADVDSVTVNVSDVPADTETGNSFNNGWFFVKFSSSQTLLAGKSYIIRLTTSSANQVTVLGTGTNISRQLRTTTTQAPASGDKLIITGEWTAAATCTNRTVTMDNTSSTTFGNVSFNDSINVSKNGTLAWGTSASTNYLLKVAGYVYLATGGSMTMGTSGTPIPSTSTAILDFVNTSNVDSGVRIAGGTFTTYGASKTTVTSVTSTANSGQAVVNVASVTGWGNNDDLVLTPTERNSSQYEQRTIQSIASLAVTVTSNFSYKHSGSASASVPNSVRGHVGILTHNVKVRGASNSLRAFISVAANGTLSMRYTEMKWLGSQFAGYKQGVVWGSPSSVDVQYCSFYNGSYLGTSANSFTSSWTFSNCVVYATDAGSIRIGDSNNSVSWTMSGNLVLNSNGNHGFYLQHVNGATLTNNIICGHAVGIYINYGSFLGTGRVFASGSFDGNDTNNNNQYGVQFDATAPYFSLTNHLSWRNSGQGILFNSANNLFMSIDGARLFGNTSNGLYLGVTTPGLRVSNCIFDGETSFGQSYGVYGGTNLGYSKVLFENCQFSQTVAHGTNDFGWNNIPILDWSVVNSKVGAATVVQTMQGSGNFNVPFVSSVVRFQRYNQTAGDHRTFQCYCNTKTDTVIYHNSSPSERVTPRETSTLLKSSSSSRIKTVVSGSQVTVSVWVRKSISTDSGGANYNGSQLRLIQVRNYSVGLTSDVVLATGSASLGVWELLSGTTSVTSGDIGAVEVYVDGDGNAGWFNVDDWSFS